MRHRPIAHLAALSLSLLLGACTHTPRSQVDNPSRANALLQSYAWSATALFNAQGQPEHRWSPALAAAAPVFLFQRGRLTVNGLCRPLRAHYAGTSPQLEIDTMEKAAVIERPCATAGLKELEQHVADHLPLLQHYALHASEPPRLVLFFSDGSRWELQGAASPDSHYAGPGGYVFLEVAPELMDCPYGLMVHARCLRVRHVQYDIDGILYPTGRWQPFYGAILGYEHESESKPGTSTVLRIQRFKWQNPAATSTYNYVLDQIMGTQAMH